MLKGGKEEKMNLGWSERLYINTSSYTRTYTYVICTNVARRPEKSVTDGRTDAPSYSVVTKNN